LTFPERGAGNFDIDVQLSAATFGFLVRQQIRNLLQIQGILPLLS
jgi:hypothetical protein